MAQKRKESTKNKATVNKATVGLLLGGRSSEHEVSLTSAASVLHEIDRSRFDVVPILITREGNWFLIENDNFLSAHLSQITPAPAYATTSLTPVILDYCHGHKLIALPTKSESTGVATSTSLPRKLDVIFPILHGPYGEDGTVQGLCDMAQIPCVGAGILGSACGLDKVAMKAIFAHQGLPILPYHHFTVAQWQKQRQEAIAETKRKLQLPVFVKPANCGSSVGISKVAAWDCLEAAIDHAFRFDRKVVIEQGISVRELECAVLGNDFPQASVVGEIISLREFYDYEAKYSEGKSKTVIPADITEAQAKEIRELAIQAFCSLDCAGFSRIDCFMDKASGKIYLNEINTIPGFTPKSMFPTLWQQSGIPYRDLITKLIELAMERFAQNGQKSYSVV